MMMMLPTTVLVVFLTLFLSSRRSSSFAFSLPAQLERQNLKLWTISSSTSISTSTDLNNADEESTEFLLETVTKAQLAQLCEQLDLSKQGTKQELLARLRDYGQKQALLEHQRRLDRVNRVEEGENSKERYEILSSQPEEDENDEEDETIFYYPLPDDRSKEKIPPKQQSNRPPLTNSVVTAPPPPDHVNEDGERAVTIYSSTEHNDLTGVAAAQPGKVLLDSLDQAAASASSSSTTSALQAYDRSATATTTTSKQIEQAKETVTELVKFLLATTGAPAFATMDGDDDDDDDFDTNQHGYRASARSTASTRSESFVGFQPVNVPTHLLVTSSKALRTSRGQVLQEVLRQFELQAIGQDGMAGDNRERGGGHYREVAKVRAFLEGYRRAELRRIARETASLLLDSLVQDGVEGLDLALATMVRSGDDTSEHAGELNDSLLDYLSDAIRQQEKKVDSIRKNRPPAGEQVPVNVGHDSEDSVSSLWTVATEDGHRVESIDPNDPRVKMILQDEYEKAEGFLVASSDQEVPDSASEQLLLLLKLLRQRIEAEAAFAPDEKGRNLRLLAYCLRASSNKEREQLIVKEAGSSLDRLDSFMEIVASSIEYGASTSHQLQPSKTRPLNVRHLQEILELSQKLRKQQSQRSSRVNLNQQ